MPATDVRQSLLEVWAQASDCFLMLMRNYMKKQKGTHQHLPQFLRLYLDADCALYRLLLVV